MKKFFTIFGLIIVLCFGFCILFYPEVASEGAAHGLLLCGNVIIPSIFPFAVFVIFTMNTNLLKIFKPFNKFLEFAFSVNYQTFGIFILSLLGGYPIGAKLLNDYTENKKITKENAATILNYCVNAGPGFIILAVGYGILKSQTLGIVLFISNTIASIIIALFQKQNIVKETAIKATTKNLNFAENFVFSTSNAAKSIFTICSFVILFSTITAILENFSYLKFLGFVFEVTNALLLTKNVYLISFLLGFGGISIWFQIFSIATEFKINYTKFIVFRVIHGLLSSFCTYLLIKVFKIYVPTFSNNKMFTFSPYSVRLSVAFSLIILGLIFIISLNSEKKGGNILKDLV